MDGILNLYKERGYTSHDAVAKLRGICRTRRIGHTGTLDPEAEGVLPVCIGRATKLCGMLTDKEKEYLAVMRLGVVTDTQDMTGTVREEHPVTSGESEIRSAVAAFTGEYDQIPPMYSALKTGGKRLYELARQGVEIERPPRRVRIFSAEVEEIRLPLVTLRVSCSRGTYIRTLCHDIGRALGCGAAVERLIRTRSGRFALEDSLRLEQVSELAAAGRLEQALLSPDALFDGCPRLEADAEAEKRLYNGNPLPLSLLRPLPEKEPEDGCRVRVYDRAGTFIGCYAYRAADGLYLPQILFLGKD